MDLNSQNDKRKYLRYELLDYAMTYPRGSVSGIRSIISDAGLGGVSLRTKERLAEGEIIDIVVGRGENQNLGLKGIVRHCELMKETLLFASGVQFIPGTHEERIAVAEYVNAAFQRECDATIA